MLTRFCFDDKEEEEEAKKGDMAWASSVKASEVSSLLSLLISSVSLILSLLSRVVVAERAAMERVATNGKATTAVFDNRTENRISRAIVNLDVTESIML